MPLNFIPSQSIEASDPFWDMVSLYIKGNGVPGSAAIVDEKGHTFTKTGSILLSSDTSIYPGGTSVQFNGAQRLIAAAAAEFAMGTGDYTIEAWINQTGRAGNTNWMALNNGSDNGIILQISGGGLAAASGSANGISFGVVPTKTRTFPFQVMSHFAITRQGANLRLFVGGIMVGILTNYTGNMSDNTFCLGATNGGAGPLTGYVNDLRITKGVARYTADFVPSFDYPTHK